MKRRYTAYVDVPHPQIHLYMFTVVSGLVYFLARLYFNFRFRTLRIRPLCTFFKIHLLDHDVYY